MATLESKDSSSKDESGANKIDLKARDKEEESQKPKKYGVLKHDLYFLDSRYAEVKFSLEDIVNEDGWWLTREQILNIVEQIKDELLSEICAPKGTKFDCYIDNEDELWYDSEGVGIEECDKRWASKNLIDVKEVKK